MSIMVPREVRLASAVKVDAAENGPRPYSMLAYTGAVFDVGFGPAVIDLAGLDLPSKGCPTLQQHDPAKFIGRTTAAFTTAAGLEVEGFLFSRGPAREVADLSDEGAEWQASVGIGISMADEDLEWIPEGEAAQVNGRELAGPFLLLRKTNLREVSFVPLGADPNTSAVALHEFNPKTKKEVPVSGTSDKERIDAIRSEFSADPEFALEAIADGLSLEAAQARYSGRLQQKYSEERAEFQAQLEQMKADLKAARKEADEAKARASLPNPAAQLGGTTPGNQGNGSGDPTETWSALLADEVDRLRKMGAAGIKRGGGLKTGTDANLRARAADTLAAKHPETHRAYLEAYNAGASREER